jgi:hypothetical protein
VLPALNENEVHCILVSNLAEKYGGGSGGVCVCVRERKRERERERERLAQEWYCP